VKGEVWLLRDLAHLSRLRSYAEPSTRMQSKVIHLLLYAEPRVIPQSHEPTGCGGGVGGRAGRENPYSHSMIARGLITANEMGPTICHRHRDSASFSTLSPKSGPTRDYAPNSAFSP
jgi:hypothetical protein